MAENKPVEPDLVNSSGGMSMKLENQIDFHQSLNSTDWLVFTITSLLSLVFIYAAHARRPQNKTAKEFDWLDYLLMGRQLSLPLFVASLVATWYGGIFGVTKIAFENGIYNFITQGVFWYASYIVFALFLVARVRKFQAVSLADLVGQMFGPKSALVAGVFNLFNVIPIVYCISLGLLIQMFLPIPLSLSMVLGLSIVFIYSSWGGLRAVVYTDVYQFLVMFLGVAIVLAISIMQFGGLTFLKSTLEPSYFSFQGKHSLLETVSWGLIAFSTLVDPNFYQRIFAADSESTARRGILICCFFWFIFDICTTFGAMYAKALIPEALADTAYLTYAIQILPHGLRGLLFASIVACIISTLDSYIFTASNTLLYDLVKRGKYLQKINHTISSAIICILSVLLAMYFEGNIKMVWKTLGSYSASCLLFPVLFAYICPNKITDFQFVGTALISVISVSLWRYFDTGFDEIYIGVLVSGTCLFLSNRFHSGHKKIAP